MARKPGQNGQELWCFMGRKQHRVKGLRSGSLHHCLLGPLLWIRNELELTFNDFAPLGGSREGRSDWPQRSECLNWACKQAGTSTNSFPVGGRSDSHQDQGHSQPKTKHYPPSHVTWQGKYTNAYHHESLSPASLSCHTPLKETVEMKEAQGPSGFDERWVRNAKYEPVNIWGAVLKSMK